MAKDFTGEQGVIITAGRTFDFTDETGAGADDGTPITKEKVMQPMAVFQHLMLDAGYVHNGLAENAVTQTPGDTQYYDALVAKMDARTQAAASQSGSASTIMKRDGLAFARCDVGADLYDSSIGEYGFAGVGNFIVNNNYLFRAIPVGTALPFCSATLPSGWLECNGAAISRTTYPLLFAAIGTTWGAGDGSTTFTLPDFRHRMLAGAQSGLDMGTVGNQMLLPSGSTGPVSTSVGNYLVAGTSDRRYAAIIKFMIRAL